MLKDSARSWSAALIIIYATMVGLVVVGIRVSHLHPDEHLTYLFTRRDWAFLVNYLGGQDTHPPLWFSLYWVWRQIFGDNEMLARVSSIFPGLLTMALVYRLGLRWFRSPRYGLFALTLLAVNGFFLYYTLEIRPYSLLIFLAALSMWTFERWLTLRTTRTAAFYGATVAAMFYVHYFAFVLVAVQAACFLIYAARRRELRLLRQAFGAAVVAAALFLPWMPSALNQIRILRAAEVVGGNERGAIGIGTTTRITSVESITHLTDLATNGLGLLYAALLIGGLFLLWRHRNYRLALAWAVGVPALSFLLNLVIAVYTPRYVVYLVVGLSIAEGAALAAFPRRMRVPALVAVVALSLWMLPGQSADLMPNRIPYRDLFRRVSALAQPGDVIYFDQRGADDHFMRWQIAHYLPPALVESRTETVEEAMTHQRVWFVTDDWFNERVQARFKRIEQSHPLQQVIGRCDRGWCYLIQLLAR